MQFSIGSLLESLEIFLNRLLARLLETPVSIGSALESLEIEFFLKRDVLARLP